MDSCLTKRNYYRTQFKSLSLFVTFLRLVQLFKNIVHTQLPRRLFFFAAPRGLTLVFPWKGPLAASNIKRQQGGW